MELTGQRAKYPALLLLLIAVYVHSDFVEPPQPQTSLRSETESQTRLPCHYQVKGGQKVVQVTWYKELGDGSKEQIITAHFTDGHTEFGRYSGRVRFESGRPTEDSALLIPNTEDSDEGKYICRISTFPNGNFERQIALTVWIINGNSLVPGRVLTRHTQVLPISSLEPVVLVEGQSYGAAASCRAVGRPPPSLSWDTELPGRVKDSSSGGGTVSSHYSLHPLRSMNGKKLDCLVAHPGLKEPRRISNNLVVHYPPDATISTATGDWFDGMENAELVCVSGGFPKPEDFTWTRRGGALPDGASVVGEKLVFGRALRMNDSGVYECVARNNVGAGKTEIELTIAGKSQRKGDSPPDNLMLIIIGASAGALVMVLIIAVLLVNRYHRHRNKKLERELNEKTEEIHSFSRQASFRRLNSVSTDPRVPSQTEDYAMLRVDSRMKNSQTSLARSQSTLGGKWGPGGEVDELGRPVVWLDGTTQFCRAELEREDSRRRVEAYLKNSNMSLDSGLPSSLIPLKAPQDEGLVGPTEPDSSEPLGDGEGSPAREEDWAPAQNGVDGGRSDDEDSSPLKISEALTNHFYFSNGVLRPKPHSNAILLNPKGKVI